MNKMTYELIYYIQQPILRISESGIGDVRGRSSYRGSGGGRGGRSKHSNFNSNSSSYKNKKETKFAPYGY